MYTSEDRAMAEALIKAEEMAEFLADEIDTNVEPHWPVEQHEYAAVEILLDVLSPMEQSTYTIAKRATTLFIDGAGSEIIVSLGLSDIQRLVEVARKARDIQDARDVHYKLRLRRSE